MLPRLAVAVTVLGFAAAVVCLALLVRENAWESLGPVLLALAWLVAASLAVRARPEHPGAFLFVCLGAGHLVGLALDLPVALDVTVDGWGAWSLNLAALLAYALGFAALAAFLATYPNGRPHTRMEHWFVRLCVPVVFTVVVAATTTEEEVGLVAQASRTTMPAPRGLPVIELDLPWVAVVPLLVVVGAFLLVARGRRSTGVERQQLAWAAGAGGLLTLMLVLNPVLGVLVPQTVSDVLFMTVVAAIPFVLLAGLVRYRLMDVDVYVTRTLASGVVVAVVLAAYAVLAGASADNRSATAALVVVAALTGIPLLRLVSRGVDRWFSGGRVRGQALLRQLAESLSSSTRDEIASRTTRAIAEGLDVSWVRLVCGDVVTTAGSPTTQEPALVVPLLAGHHPVGRLECGPRHGGWSPAEANEVQMLGRHAALALHNADLTTRLAAQVEELQASRLRIVRAELDVRRRLERDLHDGVQQQVVALIAHLGALRVLVASDSPAGAVIATAQSQASLCLSDLRTVVSGVHPSVLLDQGVVAAVESRVGLLPVPVRVVSELQHRYPAETEAAAYYVVSEALTNVVKHAAAGGADVRFTEGGDGALCVSVGDDGIGIAAEHAAHGLNTLRDRVEALGGELTVESRPSGTRVSARLPSVEAVANV